MAIDKTTSARWFVTAENLFDQLRNTPGFETVRFRFRIPIGCNGDRSPNCLFEYDDVVVIDGNSCLISTYYTDDSQPSEASDEGGIFEAIDENCMWLELASHPQGDACLIANVLSFLNMEVMRNECGANIFIGSDHICVEIHILDCRGLGNVLITSIFHNANFNLIPALYSRDPSALVAYAETYGLHCVCSITRVAVRIQAMHVGPLHAHTKPPHPANEEDDMHEIPTVVDEDYIPAIEEEEEEEGTECQSFTETE